MNALARNFEAVPAVRGESPLLIGIMAPSGGGKTYSALRLATGIQQVMGGDIYGIDTENNRMKRYADDFKFNHVPFTPPFGSLDYLAALRYCAGKGSRITIVDSMTHEHIGQGGYLETADEVVTRIAGQDYKKREAVKMLGWAKAGPLRQQMIEGIKQLDGAFIFCFRAKEKVKPVRTNGKTEVVDMGFMPIAGEEWIYEQAVNIMLLPRADGVPTWRSDQVGERLMMKLPKEFRHIFKEGEPLSEDVGRQLAEWSKGGTVANSDGALVAEAKRVAAGGTAAFLDWWKLPATKPHWSKLKPHTDEFKAIAARADQAPPNPQDADPFSLPQAPILGTLDVDAQQRAAEAEEIVSEGDVAEAKVAARDRTDALITELAAMTTTDELNAYVKDIAPDLAELPEDERGRFNVARYKREKTLKGVGK